MPIYEYECTRCGHRFEKIEHFDSPTRKKCPVCGFAAHRILPTGVGFVFKGSGFYATDYKANKTEGKEKEKKSGENPDAEKD
jgi:putative FmdB family regulatory protein